MQFEGQTEVCAYTYPSEGQLPLLWEGIAEVASASVNGLTGTSRATGILSDAGLNGPSAKPELSAEEARCSFEAGREVGLREGRLAEKEAHAEARTAADGERARQIAALVESFAQERDSYLLAVEHEVVELALAIAARILRREAQMDPLLLTGAARVALGQLSASTEVQLRVPEADLDLWKEAITHLPNLAVRPEVVVGEEMRLGDCALETRLGKVDLGVRAQLGEIEKGFFDRTGRVSAVKPDRVRDAIPAEATR